MASLNNALAEAKRNGITLRALVFINPGNPTGNCLTVSDLQQLVRFAYDNRLVGCRQERRELVFFGLVVVVIVDVLCLSTLKNCIQEPAIVVPSDMDQTIRYIFYARHRARPRVRVRAVLLCALANAVFGVQSGAIVCCAVYLTIFPPYSSLYCWFVMVHARPSSALKLRPVM